MRRQCKSAVGMVAFTAISILGATSRAQDLVPSFRDIAVANQAVTYKVKVCNNGTGPAPASKVGLYFDRDTGPGCDVAPSQSIAIEALAAGACVDKDAPRAAVPRGEYKAWLVADWECSLSETDETNNVANRDYFVGPDLKIEGPFAAEVAGSNVTYTFKVKNTGAATTAAFTVGLYYNSETAPACGATPDHSVTIPTGFAYNAEQPISHPRVNVPAGGYKAWAVADVACAIKEGIGSANEANNKASRTYGLGTDLEVGVPAVTPNGSSVEYRVRICNRGTVATGPYNVALWYDRDAAPTCGATGASYTWSGQASLPPTGDARCTTLTHSRSGAPAGSYKAYVFADPTCVIAETNSANDVNSKTYAVAAPDFTFTAQAAQPAFAATVSGTTVNYTARLCNLGAATTRDILVGLYDNAAAAPSCSTTASHTWTVNGLAAGGCTVLNHAQTNVTDPGSFTGWVLADRNCQHAEGAGKEENNARSATYAIAPSKPELHIENLNASASGQNVTYEARVCNAGTAAGAFVIGFYHNAAAAPTCTSPTADLTENVASLARDACTTITKTRPGASPGDYKAWVMVDSGCAVAEHRENNNTRSDDYAVAPPTTPDLEVETLTATPNGQTAVFSAKVCNRGTAASAATKVGIYYDRPAAPAPNCTDVPNVTADVGALAVNACETKEVSYTGATPGSFTAWALADSACTATEGNEANNSASAPYTISSAIPDAGPDVGAEPDQGPDVGSEPDAGPQADSWIIPKRDVGADDGPDAGTSRPKDGGCAVQASPTNTFGLVLAAIFCLALLGRRRRR